MNRWTLTARGRTKAARKRKSSKKHASSARKLESSEKNGRQDAHVHVQRVPATKTQRKRAPATKTQKKRSVQRATTMQPHAKTIKWQKSTAGRSRTRVLPAKLPQDASRWPISRVDVGATMHPSMYLLGANIEKLPLINQSLVSVILSKTTSI